MDYCCLDSPYIFNLSKCILKERLFGRLLGSRGNEFRLDAVGLSKVMMGNVARTIIYIYIYNAHINLTFEMKDFPAVAFAKQKPIVAP